MDGRPLRERLDDVVKCGASFLESVPAVAAQLKEPNTKDRNFKIVVKSAEPAAVLVLADGAGRATRLRDAPAEDGDAERLLPVGSLARRAG
jgi:hypothetical protein